MKNTLVDAGPLIALFDKDDIYHKQILEFLKSYNCHLYTTWPVITETLYMLSFSTEVQLDFLSWLDRGGLRVLNFDQSILKRVIDLTKKYNDLPADFADASLVAVAERENIKDIVSIDSDFNVYQTKKGTFLNNIFISS
ncbi:MAG: type II toxin-antitoxin system VapC family toxin [Bacillota bacterium]